MEPVNLLISSEKYSGQYVAFKSFSDHSVVSHGEKPVEVLSEAKEKGSVNPVLFFVQPADVTCLY